MHVSPLAGHEELTRTIGAEVAQVEAILAESLACEVGTVERVGLHTLQAGGKRLRPALVVLSARAVGAEFSPERARRLAACVEMIHMATLIHDDVIDHSPTRRGLPTASAVFGPTAAILSGDVVLAKAMEILAIDGDLEIIRMVSSAVVALSQGEVRELEVRGRVDLSEADHLAILEMKTASLIGCCCEVGARLAGASDDQREALRGYGYHIGMAFQIVDDLLDYRGRPSDTGKARATDFAEGCATLPLIRLMASVAGDDRARFAEGFGKTLGPVDLDRVYSLMEALGVFRQVERVACDHVDRANRALEALPESPNRDLLRSVAHFIVERDR